MTSTLSHLNSVASARMTEVLALSGSSFSSRQVVSFLNIHSFKLNQYHRSNIQFSWRPSTFHSRPITILPISKHLSCRSYNCSTHLEGKEEDYDKNDKNIANSRPSLYDRMGRSSSSLSSSHSSCSCNCQNASPFIQINIVFPHPFQFWAMLTHVYSKLHPLLDQVMMFTREGTLFFFQIAVSDKERALRRKLNKIAENGDTSTLNGSHYVLKEVVKALLQYSDSSIHFTKLTRDFNSMKSLSKNFEEFLNRELERHGKDENTLVNVDDNIEFKNKASKANSSIENEYTVVTLLVLASGKHLIPYSEEERARDNDSCKVLQRKERRCYDYFRVLQTLRHIPENEIQSVEVLWSPREEEKVLFEDELVKDFPALIRINKGLMYGTSWLRR